jgi:hypothetical protein
METRKQRKGQKSPRKSPGRSSSPRKIPGRSSSPRKSPGRSSSPRKSPGRSSRKIFCITPEMINDNTIRILIRLIREFIIESGFIIEEHIIQNDSTLHTNRHIKKEDDDTDSRSTISFNRYTDNIYEIESLLENTINESKIKLDFFIENVKRLGFKEKDIPVYNIGHVNSSRENKHFGKIQILLFLLETILENGNLHFIIRLDNDTRKDMSDTRPSPYTIFGFTPMTDISIGPEEFCLGPNILPSIINVLEIICKEYPILCKNICGRIKENDTIGKRSSRK